MGHAARWEYFRVIYGRYSKAEGKTTWGFPATYEVLFFCASLDITRSRYTSIVFFEQSR